jgi:hypothetical protein
MHLGLVIPALLMLAACKDDAAAATPDAGGAAGPNCKERDDHYALSTSFEDIEPSKSALPECVPTCTSDPLSLDGFSPVSGLPSGTCSSEPWL